MTHAEARQLRDRIKYERGIYCTVPNGYAPDRYFAQIWSCRMGGGANPVRLHCVEDYEAWAKQADTDDFKQRLLSKPRSPLEIMIDRACGLE